MKPIVNILTQVFVPFFHVFLFVSFPINNIDHGVMVTNLPNWGGKYFFILNQKSRVRVVLNTKSPLLRRVLPQMCDFSAQIWIQSDPIRVSDTGWKKKEGKALKDKFRSAFSNHYYMPMSHKCSIEVCNFACNYD